MTWNPLHKELWYAARRRSRQKRLIFGITPDYVAGLIVEMICRYCDRPVQRYCGNGRGAKPDSATLDRIWPELGYVPGNVVLACWKCNTTFGDNTPEELERAAQRKREVQAERTIDHEEAQT